MKTFDRQWNHVHQQRSWGRYPAEEMVRFMTRNYPPAEREKIKVLDLGCGTGANTWFLCREGFSAFAFDGAYAALPKAYGLCQTEKKPAHFLQADAGMLPFANSSFDAVIDIAALSANSTEGIERILDEIYRTLRSGGRFFSSGLFSRSTTGYKTGEKVDRNSFRNIETGPVSGIGTVHFFTPAEITSLWAKHGFENLCIDKLERTDHNGAFRVSYYIVSAIRKN